MLDSGSAPASLPANLHEVFPPDALLSGLFDASLVGIGLYKPIKSAASGEIVDFEILMFNAAAQRITGQPLCPGATYLQLFPHALDSGVFAFHRDAFEAGGPARMETNYQADGLDHHCQISALRVGEGLVLSFTDSTDETRSKAARALRESQARERAAHAEAEAQRQRLHQLLAQAPALIASLTGPTHVVELANDNFRQMFGNRDMLGKPYREAMPELVDQAFVDLLDAVYQTGETYRGTETLAYIDRTNSGRREPLYFNFIYQATRDGSGAVTGILIFASEVTEQVQVRQKITASEQKLRTINEELAAANEELQAANEEIRASNEELFITELALRELNQELEARVADRTAQLQHAQNEAERQRARLERFFMQAPVSICVLDGPELRYELVNPAYQALFPGRRLYNRPILEALPEIEGHEVYRTFRQVYEKGLTHEENDMLIPFRNPGTGAMEDRYFNYVQQARYDEHGQVDGILVFAFEVTEQFYARQRTETLQAEALKAAESLVRQRETLYQLFEQTPASVAILRGPEHRFDYVNPRYQLLFPGRLLLGMPLAEALPETVEFGFVDLLNQVYSTGEAFLGTEMPLQIRDQEGNLSPEQYYTFTYQAYQEAGQTVGVSIFAFNVTEQVEARRSTEALQAQALQAAEQLVRQRETLQQVFEQTPALVFIARGPNHIIDYVNPAYQTLFPDRTLVGKPTAEAIPEAAEHGFIPLLDHVYTTNEPYFGNEILADASPATRPRYLNFTYQAYHEHGVTVGVSSFAFDVTEQVQARQQAAAMQDEVHRRDAQLQDLFEQAPVAIAVVRGPELVVELANPLACELSGVPRAKLVGKPLPKILPEGSHGFDHFMRQVMATGEAYRATEEPVQVSRNGQLETVYLNFVYQPLRESTGEITGVAAVITDVSEQVAARELLARTNADLTAANLAVSTRNEELAAANQQLLRTNQDLDNFVYAASHDLKQPVNNLAGLIEEIFSATTFNDSEEESILVPMVDDALRQLSTTIEDLAAVGQVQRLPNLPAETVSLQELTHEVLQTLQPQVQAARARVTIDFSARPTVSYARANLRTILLNLLSNALKYADPRRPARVHLSVWVQEGRPMLLVEDNGLGFDVQRHHSELFQLFRRFHDHTEGTGVGLYLVNRIVQSNGGRVEVESEVGEGTTFRVFL